MRLARLWQPDRDGMNAALDHGDNWQTIRALPVAITGGGLIAVAGVICTFVAALFSGDQAQMVPASVMLAFVVGFGALTLVCAFQIRLWTPARSMLVISSAICLLAFGVGFWLAH